MTNDDKPKHNDCNTPAPEKIIAACGPLPENTAIREGIINRDGDGIDFIASMRKRFGLKWPAQYRHKPNTVILVDAMGYPIFQDNGDGTVSGLDLTIFYNDNTKA